MEEEGLRDEAEAVTAESVLRRSPFGISTTVGFIDALVVLCQLD